MLLRGATRWVWLTRRWALKFPSLESWYLFINGLLANMQETTWGRAGYSGLCPVRLAFPGGWLVVMPRCAPVAGEWTDEQWRVWLGEQDFHSLVEKKMDSIGLLNGVVVAVDYGS